jgi:hypothetical protein
LCLKQQSLFTEAAASYIKMTNELSDLRSAMLLEQAAYCYLLAQPASVRKYGFHIVLAGYRFSKTGGCKRHAARLYRQGAQVRRFINPIMCLEPIKGPAVVIFGKCACHC